MKYIKLDDARWVLKNVLDPNEFDFGMRTLQTIDPIATIDQMIEEVNNEKEYTQTVTDYTKDILQELKERLSSNL